MQDLALLHHFIQEGQPVVFLHLLPVFLAQAVEQINIDVVGAEALELFVEIFFEILVAGDVPDGAFGGEDDPVPVPLFQRFSNDRFIAFVSIRGIEIVHTVVDGIPHDTDGLRLVFRKPHASQPKPGNPQARSAERRIFHRFLPFVSPRPG